MKSLWLRKVSIIFYLKLANAIVIMEAPYVGSHFENLFEFLREEKKEPYLLLKHHFFFDFRKHGLRQPTMINVIRDPVDWFVSQYYFRRYGWNRKRNEYDSVNRPLLKVPRL